VLAIVVLTAILATQALFQGSSIKAAYARPLSFGHPSGHEVPRVPAVLAKSIPGWAVQPPRAAPSLLPPGRSPLQVPILMYHYIRVPPDPATDRLGWGLSTSPDDFRIQMDYLQQRGFHPVTLSDLRAYLEDAGALPDRPVVLTFDDGYEDFYTTAFPILKEHNFKAVAYIVSGFVGWKTNVSAEQVRELDAYGIEIGAHTVDHIDLTAASPASLVHQVKGSKDALEAIVGHPVLDFCYPSGRVNEAVVAAVRAAGFQSATTTRPGSVHSLDDRFLWTRVRVSGSESLDAFAQGLALYETGLPPVSVAPIVIPRVYPLLFTGPRPGLE
jgi:peptidoglycan/xylan/chitin deacetylase (PgdA/CDA1 family)